MFSYVAKSLLSKTLKTFLRKYLENIEFESISYGSSNNNSSDATSSSSATAAASASNSGWGVRLSNVKLREGMELMKLPGKMKRRVVVKKKVKRRKSKKKKKPGSNKSLKKQVEETVVGNTEKRAQDSTNNDNRSKRPTRVRRSTSQPIPGVPKPSYDINTQISIPENNNPRSSMSNRSEFDYFSSAPSTPVQNSNGMLCTPLGLCSSSRAKESITNENASDITTLPAPPLVDSSEGPKNQRGMKDNTETKIDRGIELTSESIFRNNINFDKDSDDESSDGSVIEVEEEYTVADTMSLVVGAGGAIGTLNIRFVGKELHVTVEDAHLIIEALPLGSTDDESNFEADNDEAKNHVHVRSDSTVSETSVDSIPDGNNAQAVDSTTVGEKIKKKSMLARYLSMIPHLFLRDCRVSLILPGESDLDDNESSSNSVSDCTVFECGIDFLSVTSGDDFIDVLRLDTGNQAADSSPPHSAPLPSNMKGTKEHNQSTNNIFERKRIRTGKGPEGGLWVRIHPPNNMRSYSRAYGDQHIWARQKFLESSAGYFFRCSGVDLHARLLVDVKNEIKEEIAAAWSSEYDDYTMDSMLFGVDYVDPISLTRHQIRERMKRDKLENYITTNKDQSDTDANGIQHVPFASNFHWIAEQTHRQDCTAAHLPIHDCNHCWNACVSGEHNSVMESKMPLPGFVVYLSVTDAIELNVDRQSLQSISYAKSLISGDSETSGEKEAGEISKQATISSTSVSNSGGRRKLDNTENATFSACMQPDTIFLSGINLFKVTIRVHALQRRPPQQTAISQSLKNDLGLQFRYWELEMQSLFMEEQHHNSNELSIRDITCHAGQIKCVDYAGVCQRQILLAGSKHKFDLPFTASEMLGVSTPILSDTYTVQTRLILCETSQINITGSNELVSSTGFVDLKAGTVTVDVNMSLFSEITSSANEAIMTLFPFNPNDKKPIKKPTKGSKKPSWNFQVSTNGGRVSCYPVIEISIPDAKFSGKSGPEDFSFQTLLDGLGIKYGSQKQQPLQQILLCALPETLRMHVLVFLDELTPLEEVLQISRKKGASIFLRSHAINKKLSSMNDAQKKTTSKPNANAIARRRNQLLKQLKELDDDDLESLLTMHCKKTRYDLDS